MVNWWLPFFQPSIIWQPSIDHQLTIKWQLFNRDYCCQYRAPWLVEHFCWWTLVVSTELMAWMRSTNTPGAVDGRNNQWLWRKQLVYMVWPAGLHGLTTLFTWGYHSPSQLFPAFQKVAQPLCRWAYRCHCFIGMSIKRLGNCCDVYKYWWFSLF